MIFTINRTGIDEEKPPDIHFNISARIINLLFKP